VSANCSSALRQERVLGRWCVIPCCSRPRYPGASGARPRASWPPAQPQAAPVLS
jgi:hypothetical protein